MTAGGGGPEGHQPLAIRWTDRAISDLAEIGDFIAASSPDAARRWVDRLLTDVGRAAEMPFAGRMVPECHDRQDLREVIRRTYRIVYRVGPDAIEVLTIFEGHRLFPRDAVSGPLEEESR